MHMARTARADLGQEDVARVSVEASQDEHPPPAVRDAEGARVDDAVGPGVPKPLELPDNDVDGGRLRPETVLRSGGSSVIAREAKR